MGSLKNRILIIGAGPAGLACADELIKRNIIPFIVEKESLAGGICKTIKYKGFRFDIGPHRFFTKSQLIEDVWKAVLGNDFILCNRFTRIFFNNKFFSYPIKIVDVLKSLGVFESLAILSDYLKTRAFYRGMPDVTFHDWVIKRFGRRLYLMFFKTYTEKIWGLPCTKISSQWAAQRVKGLSLFSVLKNSLSGRKQEKVKTLIGRFHYPKYGVGQMYEKILNFALEKGAAIQYDSKPVEVEIVGNKVESVSLKDREGKVSRIDVDFLVNSMPFSEIFTLLKPLPSPRLLKAAARLRYRSLIEVCLIMQGQCSCPDQWIYIHDAKLKTGRIQIYKNWSSYMNDADKSCTNLGMEYFCFKDDSFWIKSDSELISLAKEELLKIGVFNNLEFIDGFVVRVPYAYPVYTGSYKEDIKILKEYIDKIDNLEVIGRCGTHKYNNMDHSMLTGIYAARNIIEGRKKYNVWEINEDKDYLERFN